jgi:hypothetical protein
VQRTTQRRKKASADLTEMIKMKISNRIKAWLCFSPVIIANIVMVYHTPELLLLYGVVIMFAVVAGLMYKGISYLNDGD